MAGQGGKTKFKKGHPSANPKGRPVGSTNRFSIVGLAKAIKGVEITKQQTFMAAWIEAAWGDAGDMSKIIEFMLPKLRSIEGVVTTLEASMSTDLAKSIQDELRKRFK